MDLLQALIESNERQVCIAMRDINEMRANLESQREWVSAQSEKMTMLSKLGLLDDMIFEYTLSVASSDPRNVLDGNFCFDRIVDVVIARGIKPELLRKIADAVEKREAA